MAAGRRAEDRRLRPRVKIVNEHMTAAEMVDQKHNRRAGGATTTWWSCARADGLSLSYREPVDPTNRFNTFLWFAGPGSTDAAFEMSVVYPRAGRPRARGSARPRGLERPEGAVAGF